MSYLFHKMAYFETSGHYVKHCESVKGVLRLKCTKM